MDDINGTCRSRITTFTLREYKIKMEKPDKPCDTATLVDIADNIATSAREAIQIIDNILNSANPGRSRLDSVVAGMAEYMLHAPKPGDTPFDAIRTQLRSAVDACELLQRQLGDASSREYSALETEHAAFWPSLRAVMDIWLRNTRNGLEFLTQDAVPKANWKGKVAQSFRAAVLQRVRGVEKLLEGLLGDSQMVLAMLNVYGRLSLN